MSLSVNIQEQKIDIDMEEIAYQCANGDVIAFGQMLIQFCDHLEEREKKAGYSDLRFFDSCFGILIEYLSEPQLNKMRDMVNN